MALFDAKCLREGLVLHPFSVPRGVGGLHRPPRFLPLRGLWGAAAAAFSPAAVQYCRNFSGRRAGGRTQPRREGGQA